MGDVVIATSVLPFLKKKFPKSQIGFIVSSYTKCVIEKHPLVDFIYTVDHWKLDRSKKSLVRKFFHYLKTKRKALAEIKKEKYDVAIDLYLYFPNSVFLFWQAKIPVRIGYTSGGFGPLLTHPVDWQDKKHYMSFYYEELLAKLDGSIKVSTQGFIQKPLLPNLPKIKNGREFLREKIPEKFLEKGYIVVHPSSDEMLKEWPLEKWQELLVKNQGSNFFVFTGKGEREKKNIKKICESFSSEFFVDLSDKLQWEELLCVIQEAKLLISLDTCVTHIAKSFSVPNIILFAGLDDPCKWAPPESFLFFQQKSCLPCFKKEGCSKMECVRDVSVCDVYKKMTEILT
ncbi:MAG: glycosyltransferase family 9 protein [Chlamydiota bacterium]